MNQTIPSILDAVHLKSAPLPSCNATACVQSNTAAVLSMASGKTSVRLPIPLVLREVSCVSSKRRWPRVCQLMRQHSIPVYATAKSMQEFTADCVPVRLAECFAEQGFEAADVTTADAIQVNCWASGAGRASWPIGVGKQQLASYIHSLRIAVGGDAPVGVGFRITACQTDIAAAIDGHADFIGLISNTAQLSIQHLVAIRRARQASRAAGRADLPIIVSLPVTAVEDVVKLIALGASVVTIDGIVSAQLAGASLSSSQTRGGGLLSSIAGEQDPFTESLVALGETLTSCVRGMGEHMQDVGAATLNELDESCLNSSSAELARLLEIESL